jgi:hypothetical protein
VDIVGRRSLDSMLPDTAGTYGFYYVLEFKDGSDGLMVV